MFEDYKLTISPLSEAEGGGFLAEFADLPGCIASGDTVEKTITEARDAFNAWSEATIELKGAMPIPRQYSGQYVQRLPKTLHRRLANRAAAEGVSINQYSLSLLADGLARRD